MTWAARQGHVLVDTTSTNDDAARLADAGAPEGTWVVADSQSAGRGRRGRSWASPPGSGLYLSVVFRPDPSRGGTEDPAMARLTLLAGVAVADAVKRATGVASALKWPNDVVIERRTARGTTRRKLAGILAEGATSGGALQHVIVGIGVNLRPGAYNPELAARAISIEEAAGHPVERQAVLADVLAALGVWRRRVRDEGPGVMLDAWRALAPSSIGCHVSWTHAGVRSTGETAGIDADGALVVRTPAGVERIVAGEIDWE